ncbi:MAG: hypothetical protein ACRDJT_09405 [Actinomycetota bacterium]
MRPENKPEPVLSEAEAERLARLEPDVAQPSENTRGKKTVPQRILAAERGFEALKLRQQGKSYREIAEAVGYANPSGAWRAVERTLRESHAESPESLRVLEIERLNSLLDASWVTATTPGAKGQMLAVDRVLAIMKRRAELLGLDAPKKSERITKGTIEGEIERLEKQLGPDKIAELRAQVREEREERDGDE